MFTPSVRCGATGFDAVQQGIMSDEPNVLERNQFTRLMIDSNLTFICTLECSIPGCNPIVHHDPTPAQCAAFWNKEKALRMIIGLSKAIPFQDVFSPRHSNTKANLLVLAIQNPERRTNCLKLLLDGRRSGELPFDLSGALCAAVEVRNKSAIRRLIREGANPLSEAGCEVCPFVRALFNGVFSQVLKESRGRLVDLPGRADQVDAAEFFAGPNWAAASLRIVGPGKQGETLHKIFADIECQDLAKLVSRASEASAPSVSQRCELCEAVENMQTCQRCKKIICPDCMDDHLERCAPEA
jgi:hypothetical protein